MENVQLFTLQFTATNCRINAKRLTNWNSCNSGGMKKYRCLMHAYEKETIRLASHIGCAHLQNWNGTNKHTHTNTNTFQMHQNLKFMNETSHSLSGHQLMPFIQRPDSAVIFLILSPIYLSHTLSFFHLSSGIGMCSVLFFIKYAPNIDSNVNEFVVADDVLHWYKIHNQIVYCNQRLRYDAAEKCCDIEKQGQPKEMQSTRGRVKCRTIYLNIVLKIWI